VGLEDQVIATSDASGNELAIYNQSQERFSYAACRDRWLLIYKDNGNPQGDSIEGTLLVYELTKKGIDLTELDTISGPISELRPMMIEYVRQTLHEKIQEDSPPYATLNLAANLADKAGTKAHDNSIDDVLERLNDAFSNIPRLNDPRNHHMMN